ncbi:MAG: type II CAAX endopeptidase family protein [Acholeplasma sp.]|nr:type II CAAX endopeptidase family protein [Acholeplasma sp.]
MENDIKKGYSFLLFIILSLGVVAIPDLFKWNYWVKSLIKGTMLLLLPLALIFYNKEKMDFFKVKKQILIWIVVLALIIIVGIIGGYFLLRNVIDFSGITKELEKIGVSANNFIYVALYIAVINAFIEEFFFRGFIVKYLKQSFSVKTSVIISATLFALYHLLIVDGLASPLIIGAALVGLFIVGLGFNFLAEKFKTLFITYIPHMAANLAINFVALFILGIL